MTAKDLLIKSSDITVNDCNTSEEWDTCKCMLRALLVAALIDEGWQVERIYGGPSGVNGIKVYMPTSLRDRYVDTGTYFEMWPGTIADMPADIYDELKGRLK